MANFAKAASAALLLLGLFASGPAAAAQPIRLVYRVHHAVFGDIGTYSNTIERKGDVTTVVTRADFVVKMLGIPIKRQEGRHVERWVNNRLVYFHGVTKKGGTPLEVTGAARGDKFVIHSSLGTITAPASVHPANPWSANILDSHTMMRVDTGKLVKVQITGGGLAPLQIDGKTVPCREYKLAGNTDYWVWLDSEGVPLKFKVDDDTGMITFTLADCTGCRLDRRYAQGR